MDSTVTVIGNITRDPELRFTKGGAGVCTISLAVNRRWQNRQSGEWDESVSFFDATLWGDLAENAAGSLEKGQRVIVTGRAAELGDERGRTAVASRDRRG
jgi:single-strand DNA-binding protein